MSYEHFCMIFYIVYCGYEVLLNCETILYETVYKGSCIFFFSYMLYVLLQLFCLDFWNFSVKAVNGAKFAEFISYGWVVNST